MARRDPFAAASGLLAVFGTYSAGWIAMAGVTWLVTGDRAYLVMAAAALDEFVLTNGFVKSLFGRQRPVVAAGDRPGWIPVPMSSSFPSGHSSAAAFNVVLWVYAVHWRATPIAVLGAAITGSRLYHRFHHASDVVGGLVWGGLLAGALVLLQLR